MGNWFHLPHTHTALVVDGSAAELLHLVLVSCQNVQDVEIFFRQNVLGPQTEAESEQEGIVAQFVLFDHSLLFVNVALPSTEQNCQGGACQQCQCHPPTSRSRSSSRTSTPSVAFREAGT